ncbi:MAG: hypothetical protein PHS64_00480 [Candidatus Omnitrophica bacterium]|nr:hypothetical protein [Candidatus Omnitrophota bacterium]
MNNYRINKAGLLDSLAAWDGFLKRKVRLIACGGTAMTLLGIKESTKDIDLIVPVEKEHDYLIKILPELGYRNASGWGWARDDGFIFDLFHGKRVHTTGLLESPLQQGKHTPVKEYGHIYLGVLNPYDIIITKLFRANQVDIDDCLVLVEYEIKKIDWKKLDARFRDTASYDVSEDNVIKNWEHFLRLVKKKGLYLEKK